MTPTLLWYRQDLRVQDHPALHAAAERGPVLPVFCWHPAGEGAWAPGGASRWWLDRSLRALARSLAERGAALEVQAGDPAAALVALARASGARRVHASRRSEPAAVREQERVADALAEAGIELQLFDGHLLHPTDAVRTQGGMPYRVFTPFWRACLARGEPGAPLPAPARLGTRAGEAAARAVAVADAAIDALGLRPTIPWDAGMQAAWQPGEAGAAALLERFVAGAMRGYAQERDFPATPGTSRLSPHLHFGELSPRQVWHATGAGARGGAGASTAARAGADKFRSELGWREFAHHVLANIPRTAEEPLRTEFRRFPWRTDPAALRAWQRGRTGYPLVDAGMRELWTTGIMHNRVRMVVASFLVKHLLLDWRHGAQWFWETLVDADLANNTLGWQWASGCGADAAPYFRIFNPVTQGEKFDPQGAYVKRWVPELAALPAACLHAPWEAPPLALAAAGVELGRTYPAPIVDHAAARARALAALSSISATTGPAPD
ncbi:MAG: deoxyribodipyrimidine photo-lyase [Phycisphaerales bacterium]